MSDILQRCLGELSERVSHKKLTKVQENVVPALLTTNHNIVVAAPTGSGKTLLLEMAMFSLFKDQLRKNRTDPAERGLKKAVYICPIKALANEKYSLWKDTFHPLSVVIETGDQLRERSERDSLSSVSTADIVVTTPERWDSITRRWKEKTVMSIVHSVGLLLLDEIHTVHEERGAALEAIVSRMMTIKLAVENGKSKTASLGVVPHAVERVRFVAISGTLPNVEDFAKWLHVPPDMVFSFSNKDRPVPLSIHINGFTNDSNNPFAFDRFLTYKLYNTVKQYSDGKPTMIFCTSRKEVVASALRLVEEIKTAAQREGRENELIPSPEIQQLANKATDKQLKACLLLGFAFHHAALSLQDRLLVEEMFKDQYIAVVCTTTTLALGVNLPAHLVIIKGTSFFKNGKREDIPLSDMAQMCGRAGRPGLDSHGVAVVLTTDSKVKFYQSLQNGDVYSTVESQLHQHMIEHVNAEIALRTISGFHSALDWVRTTFFWIRLQRAPESYGLAFSTRAERDGFKAEVYIERLLDKVLRALEAEQCIVARSKTTEQLHDLNNEHQEVDLRDQDTIVESTRVGRSMARLYILFGTVQTFNNGLRSQTGKTAGLTLTGGEKNTTEEGSEQSDDDVEPEQDAADEQPLVNGGGKPFKIQQLLRLLCHSEEFLEIRLRQGDRGPLNELNKSVKYILKNGHKGGREVREDWHKAYILVQCQLGQLPIQDISLKNDFMRLWSLVPRVARFLVDYAWCTNLYSMALHAVSLLHCIEQHVWEDGLVLKQLDGVSENIAKTLARSGFATFQSFARADPRKIEVLCSRLPPFGSQLIQQVQSIPACELQVDECAQTSTSRATRRFRVQMKLSRESQESLKGALQAEGEEGTRSGKKAELLKKASFLLLAGHTPTDNILLQRFFSLSALMETAPLQYELVLPKTLTPEGVHVHLFMQHFVGNHVVVQLGCTAPVAPESPTSEKQGKKKRTVVVEEEKDEALQAVANEAKNSFNALMEDLRCINEERTTTTTGGKKGKRQRARSPEPSPAAVPDEEVSPNAECAAEAKTTLPPLSEDQPSKVEITRVASEPNIPPSYVREVTLRPTRSPEPFLQPPYTCAPAPASTNDYYYNPVAQPLGNFTECQGQVPQPYASRGAVHQNLYTAPYRNEITELRPPQMNTGALPNRPLNRFKFQVIAYSAQSNPPRPPQRAWEPMSGIPLQRPPAGAPQMFYDAPLSQPLVPQYGYRGEPSRASREYFNYGQGGGDYAPMNATNVSYDNPRYREPATQLSQQHGAYYQDYRPMPNPHYEPPPQSYHRETYPYDARVAAPPHFTNGPPPPPHDYTMPRPAANAFSRTPRPQSSFTRFEKSWW